jgi:hypothetical protein
VAELEASGGRCFAVGDRVVARMVARDLHVSGDPDAYVRNGASGIVLAVDEAADALDVDFEGIGVVRLPRDFIDEHAGPGGRRDVGVDHAYAVTSYAVQGATYERSTSRIDVGATRSETYVDITRGRQANHLFLTRAPDPLDGEHLPKAPDPDLPVAVSERLRRSGPERAAIEFPVIDRATRGPLPGAPDGWTNRIAVPRNGPIHLRRRHDDALRAVMHHRQTEVLWLPTTAGPWAWALGAETSDPDARRRRSRSVVLLDELALAVASEHLRPHGISDDWATEQLIAAVQAGAPAETLPQLARVLAQLAASAPTSPDGVPDLTRVADVMRDAHFQQWLTQTAAPSRRQPPVLTR